jgi:hypothetical protein
MSFETSEDDDGTKTALIEWAQEAPSEVDKLRDRLGDVWDKILEEAIMTCPIDTGTLMSTIKLIDNSGAEADDSFAGASYTAADGPSGNKTVTVYDCSIQAGDENAFRKPKEPCIYAQWVHDGHGNVPARPWLAEAVDKYADELDAAIDDVVEAMGAQQ